MANESISEELEKRGIRHCRTKNHANTGKHELWRGTEKLGEFTAWEACKFLAVPAEDIDPHCICMASVL
jgi:hypothetical protein